MSLTLLGKKKGMTQVFDDKGNVVVCTVLHVEPNVISRVITKEKQGYNAVQMASFKLSASKKKNISKAVRESYVQKNIKYTYCFRNYSSCVYFIIYAIVFNYWSIEGEVNKS